MNEIPLPPTEHHPLVESLLEEEAQFYVRRLALTFAANTSPRLANGTPPALIVANARIYEQYLNGGE